MFRHLHQALLLVTGANSMDERTMDGQTMQNNERAKNPATTKQVAVTTATLIKQASYIVGWREIHAGAPRSPTPALLASPAFQANLLRNWAVRGASKSLTWRWQRKLGGNPLRQPNKAEPLRRAVRVRATFVQDYAEHRPLLS